MALKNIVAHMDINGILTVDKLPDINQGENISVGILTVADEGFLAKQPATAKYYFEFESADGQKFATAPTVRKTVFCPAPLKIPFCAVVAKHTFRLWLQILSAIISLSQVWRAFTFRKA